MIRETLQHVASTYLKATQEPFTAHPVANYLRHEGARAIAEAIGNDYFQCRGSAGQSRWADSPWIAVFDPIVTDSARRGYYVVYLFSTDMKSVYLCIAQGTTIVSEEFGGGAHDELSRRGSLMAARLPEAKAHFAAGSIDLKAFRAGLARDYEQSVAISKRYDIATLPSEETLIDDLHEAVRWYVALTARGGRESLEDSPTGSDSDGEAESIVERRRYRQHRKLERNSKAGERAKQVHGYVCQCCGFDFEAVYGEAGADYIEAHHLTPLSELPDDVPVSLDPENDFAVLCANCHRVIHRKGSPKTIAELGSLASVPRLRELILKFREGKA